MRLNNPAILITAEIDISLLNQLATEELEVDVISFIKTDFIRTKRVQKRIQSILNIEATVVFTSKNAVNMVVENLRNKKPDWKVYCTGKTTRTLIEKMFGKDCINGTGNNAAEIAEQIIKDNNATKVYFFCGDKKRDELPLLLANNNIVVNEVEVYTTTIVEHTIHKIYDAILFFSPSAVEGYFAVNKVSDTTILFAIGNTTAKEIKKYSKNEIVVSDKPDKKELIDKVIAYFETV